MDMWSKTKARTVVQSRPAPASPILAASPSEEELAGPERDATRTGSLSPEEKESLFHDFDDYLRRSRSH